MIALGAWWRPFGSNIPVESGRWTFYYRILGMPSFRSHLFWRYLWQLLRDVRFNSWLDIGCGGGDLLIELSKRFPSATFLGIDRDPVAVAEARRLSRKANSQNISWMAASSEVLHESGFDVVTALGLLESSPNPATEIARWTSFVREGGRLVFTAPQSTLVTATATENATWRFEAHQVREWMIRAGIPSPIILEAARRWNYTAYRCSQRLQDKAFLAAVFHVASIPLLLADSWLPGRGNLLFCGGARTGHETSPRAEDEPVD